MTKNSLLSFEIGGKLNLSSFKIGEDYNLIGDTGSAYYFFNDCLDIEISEKNNLIESFDILLHNQANKVYLGSDKSKYFLLNNCNISDFLSYLIDNKLSWKFEEISSDKTISIAYYGVLKMVFYFDYGREAFLSLIHISKK